jgi:hypothetical protein
MLSLIYIGLDSLELVYCLQDKVTYLKRYILSLSIDCWDLLELAADHLS